MNKSKGENEMILVDKELLKAVGRKNLEWRFKV